MAGSPPPDGRIPSLPSLNTTLVGSEMLYIVSPGNNLQGASYNITTSALAAFMASFPLLNTTEITAGASYNALTTDTTILALKTLGSATSIVLPSAAAMQYPFGIFIKDAKGDAATNNITITFTGGQLCDGLSSLVINNAFGWLKIVPLPGGAGWYQSQ